MELKKCKVSDLFLFEKNPKEHVNLELAKKLIQKRGQIRPLLVDARDPKHLVALGGNARLKAMKELGIKHVYYIEVLPKDDKDAYELALEDNAEFGRYVVDQLKSGIEEFGLEDSISELTLTFDPVLVSDVVGTDVLTDEELNKELTGMADTQEAGVQGDGEVNLHHLKTFLVSMTLEEYNTLEDNLSFIIDKQGGTKVSALIEATTNYRKQLTE